jgi:hypothetical protein
MQNNQLAEIPEIFGSKDNSNEEKKSGSSGNGK